MLPDCCWIVERIHISRIGGDGRPSTSLSIERNPPAVVELDEAEREAAEPAQLVDAELLQLLAARLLQFPAWTSSTGSWPRMSIPIRSSICIGPAAAAIADALRKNN